MIVIMIIIVVIIVIIVVIIVGPEYDHDISFEIKLNLKREPCRDGNLAATGKEPCHT